MSFRLLLAISFLVPFLASPAAGGDLETGFGLGLSGIVAPHADHTNELSQSALGPLFSIGAIYHTDFILQPLLDLSYWSIYSSEMSIPGTTQTEKASLSSWTLIPGASIDFDRYRILGGLGLAVLTLRSSLPNSNIRTGETDMTAMAGFSAAVYRSDRWSARAGLRGEYIIAAGTFAVSARLVLSYDWLRDQENPKEN